MERYRGRVVACHLKDYLGNTPPAGEQTDNVGALQARLVEPGAGTVDFARVLDAMRATGVRHGFVEIDVSADPLRAVARGHAHLRGLQGC
jgi:sugar phosphate isomerase/epimerase